MKHIKLRSLTSEEKELSNWLNEDFFWYNEVKSLRSLQERDEELIRRIGDLDGDIRKQIEEAEVRITELTKKITSRRKYKRELFAALDTELKSIMEMRYLSYCIFDDIAEHLEYSCRTVVRKHNMAIILLNVILRGNEKNDRQTLYNTNDTENKEEQPANTN